MTTETHDDVVAMFRDWDEAVFAGVFIPGAFEAAHTEPLDAIGYRPSFTCAGELRSTTTATLYGREGATLLVTVDDTLDQVTRQNGEKAGPFTVKVIMQDGTGALALVLEEQ